MPSQNSGALSLKKERMFNSADHIIYSTSRMLRTLKSQRFYATGKITSLPGTVSWILMKDMGLMGQGQRFITQGPVNTICITIFASVYLALPNPTGAMLMGPDGCLHTESIVLQERKSAPESY